MQSINFADFRSGKISFADIVKGVSYNDLKSNTDELFETISGIIAGATDKTATFVPHDPEASTGDGVGWTLGHIVAHVTATIEEAAAISAMLARGVQLEGGLRLRYETPWESIQTAQQLQARLQESQRMCQAFLAAWPDQPHLDITITRIPQFGPMNAIATYMLGAMHGQMHFDQLRETMRQAQEAVKA